MKRSHLVVAAASLAFAGATQAGLITETINLGNFTLSGGQSAFVAYSNPGNTNDIVGYAISFNFDTSADPFAYASDLLFTFNFGGAGNWSIGGFTSIPDQLWTFQGSGSTGSGFYSQSNSNLIWEGSPYSKLDLSGFTLFNDFSFNGPVSWNNVEVTLYKVPAPGAMALLGLAGLTGARRRRA